MRTIQVEKNLYNDLRMGAQIGVELQTAVSTFGPGATVKFAIVRASGQKTSLPVRLGTQPATPPSTTTGCN